jgi:hypothetical protein
VKKFILCRSFPFDLELFKRIIMKCRRCTDEFCRRETRNVIATNMVDAPGELQLHCSSYFSYVCLLHCNTISGAVGVIKLTSNNLIITKQKLARILHKQIYFCSFLKTHSSCKFYLKHVYKIHSRCFGIVGGHGNFAFNFIVKLSVKLG